MVFDDLEMVQPSQHSCSNIVYTLKKQRKCSGREKAKIKQNEDLFT